MLAKVRGFTLIELIVVMGILAILATIVVIAVNPGRQFAASRNARRANDTRAITQAVNQYMANNNGQLPTEITTLWQRVCNQDNTANCAAGTVNLRPLLVPNYLTDIPKDPQGGTDADTAYWIYKTISGQVVTVANNAELNKIVESGGTPLPDQISGLQLWLRAESLNNLSNNAIVSSWPNANGSGITVTQSTAARQPLYIATALNGRPAVRFDGSDSLTISSGADARTVFLVAKHTAINNVIENWFSGAGGSDWWYAGTTDYSSKHIAWHLGGSWRLGAAAPNTSVHVMTYDLTTTAATAYVDGALDLSYAATLNPNGTIGFLGSLSGLDRYVNGDIFEFIVYNTNLTTEQRQQVEKYLGSKYGITIP